MGYVTLRYLVYEIEEVRSKDCPSFFSSDLFLDPQPKIRFENHIRRGHGDIFYTNDFS